jgi:hypothetical protein
VVPSGANSSWDERVVVILRHLQEIEEYEGGHEAVTNDRYPHSVFVIGSDRNSAQAALNRALLLQNLMSVL